MFYFIEALCQTINYADDNSLAKTFNSDINVIKVELEVASRVAIQWFKENFM